MNRRQWLLGAGTLLGATVAPRTAHSSSSGIQSSSPATAENNPLPLAEYEPKSMLHTRETRIERPRYAAIDFHTHISNSKKSENGVALSPERRYLGTPQELLAVMDRKHLQAMVNLTGGFDSGLADAVTKYDRAFPGRFYTFTEPCYSRFKEPDYPRIQADAIQQAHHDGARGLKILKTLGLYLRENITAGTLVKIDDRRFDPMWDACGQLNIPVAIHVSDPIAFFLLTDRFNERYEELSNHPDWSFYDHDFPSNTELLEARNRVMARHPQTQFVVLHVGNFAENLDNVSENLDRFPNMSVDIAARIGELGRQPRAARKFFDKYQDRIVFGTDATPHGDKFPQQVFGDALYEIYYRFLESDDEYFDYAPAKVPPQGRWKIYGIELGDPVLKKVYYENAARLLRLP
ncbi:MAG TPA: amidohydrolase family protein [Candidatus Sulfotelmatobacter sp.]|nr:amidohydrolase family protein [Candidatus Sulfotelmatobacter sp.]